MRPKDHILDVYGAFARQHGGWIAVGDLIALMSVLGLDAQAVRSATSRMKSSGLLDAKRVDGRAGYALSAEGNEILDEGDQRIFVRSRIEDSSQWIVALFSVPESERKQRYLIRSRLQQIGFAPGPAASWIAPDHVLGEADRMLERTGLGRYVTFFLGAHHNLRSGSEAPIGAWDFDAIEEQYNAYLAEFSPLVDTWEQSPGTDHDAFALYMHNLGSWRPLPYLDPQLPDLVTPDGWPGEAARTVFATIERKLQPGALRYFDAVLAESKG